jgi:hypothetical protein
MNTEKFVEVSPAEIAFSHITFENISDPHLRQCLKELPTSFNLPKETVKLLRVTAAQLLMTSDSFIQGMQGLDPTWKPHEVLVDRDLIECVCDPKSKTDKCKAFQ